MTDVDTRATTADLSALRVSQLQAIASELGIPGGSKLRKGELVTAISEVGGGRLRVGLRVGGDELVGGLAAVHVLRGLARGLGRGVHDAGARGPAGSAAGARGRLGAGCLGEGLLRAACRGLGDAGLEAGTRGLGGGRLDGLGDA
ncbi:Rho termination factor N-terminal domain-containing protein, partial [Clavibacter michiganensis]|uniref:Rho termination factor N-terminal domain-containing protein n=1 Tax=Clavibacter michiganensis TaxID=28447 RepID=UPI002930AC16